MDQITALNILKTGKNVYLTGKSGAGKSYTIRQYIAYLRKNKIPVAVTGSTGIAAINVNGVTIHSWSGIGINSTVTPALIKKIMNNRFKYESIMSAKVLIIDEISMLHAIQFNMVDQVLRTLRNNDLPFGGLQIICVGDHNQLPPVDKEGRASKDKFCFMTPAWVKADFKVCYLTEVHRQSAGQFVDILNAIRTQTITTNQIQVLKNTINNDLSDTPLHLYTHNVDVEMLNVMQLEQLEGDKVINVASEMGDKYLLEQIKANARAPERLELKLNAKVMFVRNDVDGRYVNGTQGTVKSFIKIEGRQVPIVMTLDGHEIVAHPVKWTIENNHGKPLAIYSQVPLRLAYAITVHSSQGMTLQEAEIDLTKTFEPGQGYVALSRLKTIEGLRLIGVNQRAFLLDSLALKADKRFLELSAVNVKDYTAVRSTEHTDFLKRCKSFKGN